MEFPDFSDFLKQVREEQDNSIIDKIKKIVEESTPKDVSDLSFILAKININFTIGLLRKYHDWLSENIHPDNP